MVGQMKLNPDWREFIEFQDCFATKIQTLIDGVSVNFIDAENLKRNKRASGRAQDLADIENLE